MGRIGDTLGIRPVDVGATAAVLVAVEISVATGGGKDAHALNALAYLAGAILVIPVLFRPEERQKAIALMASATSPRREAPSVAA